jgi:hypothetical protein
MSKWGMAEKSESPQSEQPLAGVVDVRKPSRSEQVKNYLRKIFKRGSKTVPEVTVNPVRKNEFSTGMGKTIDYDTAQKKLFEERLQESKLDYTQMLDQLVGKMDPDKVAIFKTMLDQNNPLLMKALTLHLIDNNQFSAEQKNIQIKKQNRELTNKSLKKGEEPGGDHEPFIDPAEKAAKVALYKNLEASFDRQIRQQFDGKKDLRPDLAFTTKDMNLLLRSDPLFAPPAEVMKDQMKKAVEQMPTQKGLVNPTVDQELASIAATLDQPKKEE